MEMTKSPVKNQPYSVTRLIGLSPLSIFSSNLEKSQLLRPKLLGRHSNRHKGITLTKQMHSPGIMPDKNISPTENISPYILPSAFPNRLKPKPINMRKSLRSSHQQKEMGTSKISKNANDLKEDRALNEEYFGEDQHRIMRSPTPRVSVALPKSPVAKIPFVNHASSKQRKSILGIDRSPEKLFPIQKTKNSFYSVDTGAVCCQNEASQTFGSMGNYYSERSFVPELKQATCSTLLRISPLNSTRLQIFQKENSKNEQKTKRNFNRKLTEGINLHTPHSRNAINSPNRLKRDCRIVAPSWTPSWTEGVEKLEFKDMKENDSDWEKWLNVSLSNEKSHAHFDESVVIERFLREDARFPHIA